MRTAAEKSLNVSRDRSRLIRISRPRSLASQGAVAGQYDGSQGVADARIDQRRRRSARAERARETEERTPMTDVCAASSSRPPDARSSRRCFGNTRPRWKRSQPSSRRKNGLILLRLLKKLGEGRRRMTKTIGLIGAGHIGSQIARLAVSHGYSVVISNSRGPETLAPLVAELGPRSRAATAVDAAKAGDIVRRHHHRSRTTVKCPWDRSPEKSVIDNQQLLSAARWPTFLSSTRVDDFGRAPATAPAGRSKVVKASTILPPRTHHRRTTAWFEQPASAGRCRRRPRAPKPR